MSLASESRNRSYANAEKKVAVPVFGSATMQMNERHSGAFLFKLNLGLKSMTILSCNVHE